MVKRERKTEPPFSLWKAEASSSFLFVDYVCFFALFSVFCGGVKENGGLLS